VAILIGTIRQIIRLFCTQKLNRYLAVVESGEIFTRCRDAKGRPVAINVVFKFRPDQDGWNFLAKARDVIESAGLRFRYEIFAESYGN
jgi:uncharacterized protein DUF6572